MADSKIGPRAEAEYWRCHPYVPGAGAWGLGRGGYCTAQRQPGADTYASRQECEVQCVLGRMGPPAPAIRIEPISPRRRRPSPKRVKGAKRKSSKGPTAAAKKTASKRPRPAAKSLDDMKVAELKEIVVALGGRPGQLRKAELIDLINSLSAGDSDVEDFEDAGDYEDSGDYKAPILPAPGVDVKMGDVKGMPAARARAQAPVVPTRGELQRMTVAELEQLARNLGVEPAKLRKSELVELLDSLLT